MVDLFDTELGFDLEGLIIRHVRKADLRALEWGQQYQKYRQMYAHLFRSTQSGKTLMWVVEIPTGEIIGQTFVMLNSSEREAADGETRAYLFAFRIKPEWRGKGIGTHLMDFVEDDLRTRGFGFVTLNVSKDNPNALRLYRRLGYQITGSQSGIWSYRDHEGKLQYVEEPAWRMMKQLGPQ